MRDMKFDKTQQRIKFSIPRSPPESEEISFISNETERKVHEA